MRLFFFRQFHVGSVDWMHLQPVLLLLARPAVAPVNAQHVQLPEVPLGSEVLQTLLTDPQVAVVAVPLCAE